jgi:acetyltransferase-like isoleucine patch superfamily enzyme
MNPIFYNPKLGFVKEDQLNRTKLVVEDDVWFGHNCIILSNVSHIGRGAVIAAGSIVTRNVPRYAIVKGSPAKISRYRFSPEKIQLIENSLWWTQEPECASEIIKSLDLS